MLASHFLAKVQSRLQPAILRLNIAHSRENSAKILLNVILPWIPADNVVVCYLGHGLYLMPANSPRAIGPS